MIRLAWCDSSNDNLFHPPQNPRQIGPRLPELNSSAALVLHSIVEKETVKICLTRSLSQPTIIHECIQGSLAAPEAGLLFPHDTPTKPSQWFTSTQADSTSVQRISTAMASPTSSSSPYTRSSSARHASSPGHTASIPSSECEMSHSCSCLSLRCTSSHSQSLSSTP